MVLTEVAPARPPRVLRIGGAGGAGGSLLKGDLSNSGSSSAAAGGGSAASTFGSSAAATAHGPVARLRALFLPEGYPASVTPDYV